MYELFDKDCNGVIDFEEFVTSFGFSDEYKESIDVLQKLLEKGFLYQQIKDYNAFIQAAKQLNFTLEAACTAFSLIPNVNT